MTIRETSKKIGLKYKLSPLDLEILLSLALKKSKEFIYAHPDLQLTNQQSNKFSALARKRYEGEPIAYITGKKEFFGLELNVNKNVLIPRPETESIVEQTLKKINYLNSRVRRHDKLTLIDIGTGSGNIIISIVKNISKRLINNIDFFAIDISKSALKNANANAKRHNVEKEIRFIHGNTLKPLLKNKKLELDNLFIVANLPYVSSAVYKANYLNLKYEPKEALVSNKKGLEHYRRLIREIQQLYRDYFPSNVTCFFEISPEQRGEILDILEKYLPKAKITFFKDLAGKWRTVVFSIRR